MTSGACPFVSFCVLLTQRILLVFSSNHLKMSTVCLSNSLVLFLTRFPSKSLHKSEGDIILVRRWSVKCATEFWHLEEALVHAALAKDNDDDVRAGHSVAFDA